MPETKTSWSELLEQCESDLRAGHANRSAIRLRGVPLARIPREYRLPIANVSWRSGLVSNALKILSPVIYPKAITRERPASAEETAEYANLLLKSGATAEATQLLESLNPSQTPEALLFRAFGHFARWEHGRALPLLEAYIQSEIPDYKRLVGRVNLAAALEAVGEHEKALDAIGTSINQAEAGGYKRLLGNCCEIRAQVHLSHRDFERAREDLELAAKLLRDATGTYDHFVVVKWRALMKGLEHQDLQAISEFRSLAVMNREWESVREADRFHLLVHPDEDVFRRLVFGTPPSEYRNRVMREMKTEPLPQAYVWGHSKGAILEIQSGVIRDVRGHKATGALNPGKKVHRVLEALSRDFYRPVRLAALFAEIFPQEKFNIFTSPTRVHGLLKMTRRWIDDQKIPLRLEPVGGAYRLTFDGPFGLEIPLVHEVPESETLRWRQIVSGLGQSEFTAKQAQEVSGLSRTSMQRLLNWALREGKVERHSRGIHVFYRAA